MVLFITQQLESILHFVGFDFSSLQMILYLTDRFHSIKIADTLTEPSDVVKDVPQGSILGPLLFIVHKNYVYNKVLQFSHIR